MAADTTVTDELIDELVNDIRKTLRQVRVRGALTCEFREALRDALVSELVHEYGTEALAHYIASVVIFDGAVNKAHEEFCSLDRAFGPCPLQESHPS